MTTAGRTIPVEALLEHASWVRALARRLTDDAARADDLAQSAWVAALEHPPREHESLRRWLAAVVRNLARAQHRGDARRAERELRAATAEALPSACDVVERAALQRRLAGAVLELDEPYRSTVLMRFFEDLAPREVARRQGVPVATVRTRVARALERLRARLDDEHGGDRRAWLAALLPLTRPHGAPPVGLATPLLLMNAKLKLALVLLAVGGAFAVWYTLRTDAPARESLAAAGGASRPAPVAPSAAAPAPFVPRDGERAPAATPVAPAASAAPAVAAAPAVRGRVLDCEARPLGGLRVVFRTDADPRKSGAPASARTGSDGAFELARPLAGGVLSVDEAAWTTVLAGLYDPGSAEREQVLVVAPRIALSGRVIDEAGAPIAGAAVRVELPNDLRSRFREVLDRAASESWEARSDAEGAFDLAAVPVVEGARLSAALDPYLTHSEPLPTIARADLALVLARPTSAPGFVSGRVVDPAGLPVEGARVAFGIDTTLSDREGAFHFAVDDPASMGRRMHVAATWLAAVKAGYMPARFDAPLAGGEPVWPAEVLLHLGSEPLAIAGRVVDSSGEPLAGALVWVADPTLLGASQEGPLQIENVLAGADGEFWHSVKSDADGRFALTGLLARDYSIEAMSEEDLLRTAVEHVAAGTRDLEIRLPTDTLYPRLAGRLLSRSGRPVAGARVAVMCDAFRARFQGEIIGTQHRQAKATESDADGRFEIRGVPRDLVYLRIDGDDILPLEFGRWVEGDRRFDAAAREALKPERIEKLEIEVDLRCHVQIELADPASADEVALLDEKGRELEISVFEGASRSDGPRAALSSGRSPALAVSDAARTLVLYKAGQEVARRLVELQPGDLQLLRL